jgi:GNAT superfamily N-acetyltransferase
VPICRDPGLLRRFIELNRPAAETVFNMLYGRLGGRPRWVRIDDPANPRAVLCRARRFTLFADSPRAAARVVGEIPRNMRMVFSSTPTRFCRLIRHGWRGPDARRRAWYNHCHLYVLEPGRLVIDRSHRVSRLRLADAGIIARLWPYGRGVDHIRRRIENGPGYCVRRSGEPVAWGLTHEDGSMGFLHVLEAYRGSGMARSLTTALAGRLVRLGVRPFLYIVTTNAASIRLTEGMGFTRAGRYSWFGTR